MRNFTDSLIDRPLRMRWVMIGFGFFATILNYVHRLTFNYLSADGPLRKLIPDDAFGYLGTAFFIAYMISNAVSGFVIDRLGTRLGYSLCMAFWTTAGLIHAFAITPLQFGICRFLLGIGEAGNWPAGVKLVAEWFPPHERSTASGIFNSGAALGAMIVPPLVAWLGINYGWQFTFVVLGIIGYIWVAAFWFIYYTPEKTLKQSKARIIPPLKLLKTRFVLTFTLSKFFLDPVWYFVTFWVGRYLADVHHWKMKEIGWFAIIPFLMADIGNIIGGYFTQFIIKKGIPISKARKLSVALAGCTMGLPLLLAPVLVTTPMSALILFGISGFGYTAYNANSLAYPADVVPKTAAASVWGISGIGAGLGGALFQGLSGYTVAKVSAKVNYTTAYNYVFIGYGLIALLGVAVILFLLGPLKKNEELHTYVDNLN